MKVTVEDISPVQKRLSVEVPSEVVTKELDSAYNRLKKQVRVKGFRKGKVPRTVLERMYREEVEAQVLERLIQDTLPKALEETEVTLVLQPRLDSASKIRPNEAFSYSAVLEIWPEFELPEYKGLEIVRPKVDVADDEVQEQLEALRRHYGKIEELEKDRPLEKGDIAIIDYTGFIDDEEVDGLLEENYYLEVGTGYLNESFEEQIVGMQKGEEREVKVTYPEDAVNAKVAGKTVTYKVYLRDIRVRILPELDDEFARQIGAGLTTLDDLKERLRSQIKQDKEAAVDSSMRKQVLEQLRQRVDFPIPEGLVELKLGQMVDNVASHLQERGLDLERAGISEERLKENMRRDALEQVKTEIILDKIAEAEEIEVASEELDQYMKLQSAQLNIEKEQLEAAIVNHVLPKLRARKTLDFLLEHAKIKEVDELDEQVQEEREKAEQTR